MPVEDRKDTIAFIICVNNELYFEECRYYIEHLEVSAGYDIDVILSLIHISEPTRPY